MKLIVALGVVKKTTGERAHQTKFRFNAAWKSYTMVLNNHLISNAMSIVASAKVQGLRVVKQRHVQLAKAKELLCRQ